MPSADAGWKLARRVRKGSLYSNSREYSVEAAGLRSCLGAFAQLLRPVLAVACCEEVCVAPLVADDPDCSAGALVALRRFAVQLVCCPVIAEV